jgi:hypothetical protein
MNKDQGLQVQTRCKKKLGKSEHIERQELIEDKVFSMLYFSILLHYHKSSLSDVTPSYYATEELDSIKSVLRRTAVPIGQYVLLTFQGPSLPLKHRYFLQVDTVENQRRFN